MSRNCPTHDSNSSLHSPRRSIMFPLLLLAGVACASPTPLFKREVFQNDVLPNVDLPDPSLFYNYLNSQMYVFATAAEGKCIPYTSTRTFPSRDFAPVQEAFPSENAPGWSQPCSSWAPDVNIAVSSIHSPVFDHIGLILVPSSPTTESRIGCTTLPSSRIKPASTVSVSQHPHSPAVRTSTPRASP